MMFQNMSIGAFASEDAGITETQTEEVGIEEASQNEESKENEESNIATETNIAIADNTLAILTTPIFHGIILAFHSL